MKEILHRQNSCPFLAKFLPASLLGVCAGYCQRALVDESAIVRTQMGTLKDLRWSQCMGRLIRYHPVTVTVHKEKKVSIFVKSDVFGKRLDLKVTPLYKNCNRVVIRPL
jgi:hypothetical protein